MLRNIGAIAAHVQLSFGAAVPEVFRGAFDPASGLFSLQDCERLFSDDGYRLGEFHPGHEKFSLVHNQALVPDGQYRDLEDARRLHAQGATLLFRSVHRYETTAREACQELADATGIPTHANVYLTPAGGQGFPLHSDPDTVLATQITGEKTWLLFKPRATDPTDHDRVCWVHEDGRTHEVAPAATAACTFTIRPGDILLAPRGWGHYALASDDGPSLHVSLGILHPEMERSTIMQQEPVMPKAA